MAVDRYPGGQAMPWVQTVDPEAASERLQAVYAKVRQRAGTVPNIARLQSLRPATMERGFDLYCQIMDDPSGISRRERVLIATVVSKINGCLY
jgi:uncharacterized peroxidase-related enzyme